LFCEHCRRLGHTVDKCFKIHGYPNKTPGRGRGGHTSFQGKKAYNSWAENTHQEPSPEPQMPNLPGLNPEQSKQLLQFLTNLTSSNQSTANEHDNSSAHMAGTPFMKHSYTSNAICCVCTLESGTWILDSGASDHMSHDASLLHDLQLLACPVLVSLPNGYKVKVTHSGKLKVTDSLVLDHVLLVPHFKFNLLSIKKLTCQLHCNVIFSELRCGLRFNNKSLC